MDQVIQVFTSKYFDFSGRAPRKEYWLFALFYLVVYIVAIILDMSFGLFNEELQIGAFSVIISLAFFIPCLAVSIRRLHDTNKSGWFFLLVFVPILGPIALLVFFCIKGTDGPNRFGDDPLSSSFSGTAVAM